MEVFVMDPKFLKYIKNDNTYLEQEPLKDITKKINLLLISIRLLAMYGFFKR